MIKILFNIFELSFKTIRGKINLGFISLCAAMFMVMIILLGQARTVIKQYEYYLQVVKPLTIYSLKLNESTSRLYGDILDYNHAGDAESFSKAKQNVQLEASFYLDTLQRVAAISENPVIKEQTMLLLGSFPIILETMATLSSLPPADQKQHIQSRLVPSIQKLKQASNTLVMTCDGVEKQFRAEGLSRGRNIILYGAILVSLITLIGMVVTSLITRNVVGRINSYSAHLRILLQGKLLQTELHSEDEFQEIAASLNDLNKELSNVRSFAREVGSGKFDTDISVFHNSGELGEALEGMRNSLKEVSEKEEMKKWEINGITTISEIIRRNHGSLEELCDNVLTALVEYVGINQGEIFVLNEDSNKLEAKAVYAWGRKKYLNQEIAKGEGITGQAFLDGVTQYMTEIPPDYVRIKAGIGEALPTSIITVPLKYQEKKVGIMEFASFKEFQEQDIKLLEEIAEILAVDIINKIANEKTKKLLQEAQEYAERLNAQEEELRQNMEELTATQEEMEKKQHNVAKSKEELEERYQEVEAKIEREKRKTNALLEEKEREITLLKHQGKSSEERG